MKDKYAGQIVGSFPSARKRKRGTVKGWEENVARENSGIETGNTHKGDDARVLVEGWNKKA